MAVFYHGAVCSVDYTPTADVINGQVILVGELPMVSHQDIPANEIGALAAKGGVYKDLTDGTVTAEGIKVNWDSAASRFTTNAVSATIKHFGFSVPGQGAAAADTEIAVIHCPDGA